MAEKPVCAEQKKLFLAQAEKEAALAEKTRQEAAVARFNAMEAEYSASRERMKMADEERAEKAYLASDANHHVFRFTAEVMKFRGALYQQPNAVGAEQSQVRHYDHLLQPGRQHYGRLRVV